MQDVDAQWDPDVVGPALTLISGKWLAPILAALHDGPLRRTTLRGRLDGVSDKILTATLRRMERGGLITPDHDSERADRDRLRPHCVRTPALARAPRLGSLGGRSGYACRHRSKPTW